MNRILLAAVAAGALLGAGRAHAFHCQNRLVAVGDPSARVRSLCGEPAEISTRVVERSVAVHRRVVNGVVVSESETVSVAVERWVYDFGPQRFMRELVFEDGVLRTMRTLGYGTPAGRAPDPKGKSAALPQALGPSVPSARAG